MTTPVRGFELPRPPLPIPLDRRLRAPVCAVFDRCRASPSPAAVRDAALLSVFFGAGLAFPTIAALDRRDYDGGLLRSPAGALLRAREDARQCLDDWCWLRGDGPGPLFPPVDGSGSVARSRPTAAGLETAVRRRMASAGLADMDPGELTDPYRSPWWSEEPGGGSDR